ncbi:MAG: SagB/ThcOx family dehydrogenase, partial [Gemmatimonadota bacterium]
MATAEPARAAIVLPEPDRQGTVPVETALARRRSIRAFAARPLSLAQVAQLLWAAQGVTGAYGMRTAPSAGALYPLETLLVAGAVQGLDAGLYRYAPREHRLSAAAGEDLRRRLFAASLEQGCVVNAAVSLVLTAVYGRVTGKYGERGQRYA